MLVIVSDLHLNDGTLGDLVGTEAFEVFANQLRELAARASWRTDGQYRPVDSIELLLLGDVLDLTHSHHWLSSTARPWHDVHSGPVVGTTSGIAEGILEQNGPGLAVLHAMTQGQAIHLPPADSQGCPAHGTAQVPVRVRAHYMVGDHDWLLHIRDSQYDAIRQRVIERLGLANQPATPFPHDPYDSDEILGVLRRHRVLARHGDLFDPLAFSETRDSASVGDAFVIELVHRFVIQLRTDFADALPRAVLAGLQQLPHLRPMLLIPVWLEGLMDRSGVRPDLRQQLKRRWDRLADEFLQLPLIRQYETWGTEPPVDDLRRAIKFTRCRSVGGARKTLEWLENLGGGANESWCGHALAEPDFRNRRARHIVYGHTHRAESVPLDASYADGYVLNQVYFNTGTWRRVFRQTQWLPGEPEFVSTDTMSFAAFYQGDERGGRSFEIWTGTLATAAEDNPVRRLDVGRPAHAAEQLLPAPKVPLRPPHFRGPVSRTHVTGGRQ